MTGSTNSLLTKLLPIRSVRAVALLVGLPGLIASSILFWGVFSAEGGVQLSKNGFTLLLGVIAWNAFSIIICLWGINKLSIVNYLRLLGFPLAFLASIQFEEGPAFGLFYFSINFITAISLWNIALSLVQRLKNPIKS